MYSNETRHDIAQFRVDPGLTADSPIIPHICSYSGIDSGQLEVITLKQTQTLWYLTLKRSIRSIL